MSELREDARNRWPSILPLLGVDPKFLRNKQGPCPVCGGKDRFRFDNKNGEGTFFCNSCGGGDGARLLTLVNEWSFPEVAKQVREKLGQSRVSHSKPKMPDDKRLKAVRDLWRESVPVQSNNEAGRYLIGRGFHGSYSDKLRHIESCAITDVIGIASLPAMLGMVCDPEGKPITIHRTYLQDGRKANVSSPRRMMAGHTPLGSYIPLAPAGEELAVAEGIETALAVTRDFGVPCWSLINADGLAAFAPPEIVRRLRIFGDCDHKFGGQAAAYSLAHRLACRPDPIEVSVEIPTTLGTDWADQPHMAMVA